jgi:ketosteroid isomerase-like protein
MNIDHPHALLAKLAWEAVSVGDSEALAEICSEDLVWNASGRGARSGVYRGQEAVFGFLAAVGDLAERFDSTLEDILVGNKYVSVLFRVSGRRGERKLDTGYILIYRIEDSRIAEIWAVPRDQYAVDEFWAPDPG